MLNTEVLRTAFILQDQLQVINTEYTQNNYFKVVKLVYRRENEGRGVGEEQVRLLCEN